MTSNQFLEQLLANHQTLVFYEFMSMEKIKFACKTHVRAFFFVCEKYFFNPCIFTDFFSATESDVFRNKKKIIQNKLIF